MQTINRQPMNMTSFMQLFMQRKEELNQTTTNVSYHPVIGKQKNVVSDGGNLLLDIGEFMRRKVELNPVRTSVSHEPVMESKSHVPCFGIDKAMLDIAEFMRRKVELNPVRTRVSYRPIVAKKQSAPIDMESFLRTKIELNHVEPKVTNHIVVKDEKVPQQLQHENQEKYNALIACNFTPQQARAILDIYAE